MCDVQQIAEERSLRRKGHRWRLGVLVRHGGSMASMCRRDVWMCRDWIAAAELGFLVAANRRYEPVAGFGEGVGVVDWPWLRKRHGCFGLRQQGNSQRQLAANICFR
jgi:hypothetical protein